MSKESSLQLYNKILNSVYWNKVVPIMIESFVEFYKEENRSKIQNLFNKLILLHSDHINRMTIEEEAARLEYGEEKEKSMCEKIAPILDQEPELNLFHLTPEGMSKILSRHPSVTLEDFMNAKRSILENEYYQSISRLAAQSKEGEPLVIGTNITDGMDEEITSTLMKKIECCNLKERMNTNMQGLAIMGVDFISLILLYGYGLPIHTIIHEVNHLLSRETLIVRRKDQPNIMSFGISDLEPTDWIYEIINDYMADEIEEIFNRRLKESNYSLCSYIFSDPSENHCLYPKIDRVCNNIIQNFYQSSKELTKDCLIKGEGRKIYKIIEPQLYKQLNQTLSHIADSIKEESNTYYYLDERLSNLLLNDSMLLKKHLETYHQYQKTMEQYRKRPLR